MRYTVRERIQRATGDQAGRLMIRDGASGMIMDWELWAVATRVVRDHGTGAAEFALDRARGLEAGGEAGAGAWERILERIGELQRGPHEDDMLQ